jgi:FixJ family two-component response regulator
MPTMTGAQMADAIWALRPELPGILMTGNPVVRQERTVNLDGFRSIITKPVSISEITSAIQVALAGPGSRGGGGAGRAPETKAGWGPSPGGPIM